MLVMRRRAGESFMIGEDVEIEVLEIAGTRVKLGIVAPEAIPMSAQGDPITRDENVTAARECRGSLPDDRCVPAPQLSE